MATRELDALTTTLTLLEPYDAQPVLADAGPRGRRDGVFYHHMGTRVQTPGRSNACSAGRTSRCSSTPATSWPPAAMPCGRCTTGGRTRAARSRQGCLASSSSEDWLPARGDDPAEHIAAQKRNREWLRMRVGI